MTAEEILALSRGLLDDTKLPYLWAQAELLIYHNKSINDVTRRTKCLRDSTDATLCYIKLLSGVHTYTLDERILNIYAMKLSAGTTPLTRTSEAFLNARAYDWQNTKGTPSRYIPEAEHLKLRVWPYYDTTAVVTGSGDISFTAATKKITKASGLSVYAVGDQINVSGTTNNNGYFTITNVLDTELTVSGTLVNENNTSAVLRKVRETANLSIARLPLTPVLISNLGVEPPYEEQYHIDLVEGILSYAYLKQDTETYDPQKAMRHLGRFNAAIEAMKKDFRDKTHIDDVVGPHPGTI